MTFARRYRLDTLRRTQEHLTDEQLDVIEAATAAMVASNRRQNDSPECDEPNPLLAARSAPNSAGRPEPSPSAPVFNMEERDLRISITNLLDGFDAYRLRMILNVVDGMAADAAFTRAISATSSGQTGPQTSGTSAKTSRDNAQVAAAGATSAGRDGGDRFQVDDRVRLRTTVRRNGIVQHVSDSHGLCYSVKWPDGELTWEEPKHLTPEQTVYRATKCDGCGHVLIGGSCPCRRIACHKCSDSGWQCDCKAGVANDLDLDPATAEALADDLRAVTEQPAGDVDLRPGDRVEVLESRGSKTGDRVAIGKFVGYEDDVRGRDYGKWRLVEVYGSIRRFGAADVRRVG